jgi:CubicO group peptidase (beta-lactamase class C family)
MSTEVVGGNPNAEPADALRALGLSHDMVRAHVIRPEHVATAKARAWPHDEVAVRLAPPASVNRLDVKGFADDLDAALRGGVAGYAMQLRHHGQIVASRQWQSARSQNEGDVAWAPGVAMHVASVSKLITAMAMTRLLRDAQASPEDTVARWLPDYWQKGPGVNQLTFGHLLTHTSGLNFGPGPAPNPDPTPTDFAFMKAQIAQGTTNIGSWCYQNCNYGLCRILVSTMSGVLAPSTTFTLVGIDLDDQFWDLTTINGYRRYIVDSVFGPAGVSGPTLDHPAADALAYAFPRGAGWDSADLSTASGGVGWHISADDLLDVMGAFRRAGTIVSPVQAEAMLADGFGLESPRDVPLGRIHWKGGWWQSPDALMRVEQSSAYFLPDDMELAVLVNSPYAAGDVPGQVEKAIRSNTHPPFFPIRGVLLAGGFRTTRELNAMSPEDMRNTLIVEMTNHSNQADYQAYDNDALAGVGAVMVFLRRTGIRDDAALRTMSADDQRNTLIVELDAQTHLGLDLQAFGNLELVLTALGG